VRVDGRRRTGPEPDASGADMIAFGCDKIIEERRRGQRPGVACGHGLPGRIIIAMISFALEPA